MKSRVLSLVLALVLFLTACVPTGTPTSAPASPPASTPPPVPTFTSVPVSEPSPTPAPVTAPLPEIIVDAADYSFRAPDSLKEGWMRVILNNSGAEPHHVQFMRLNEGVTLAQFEDALKQGEGPAMALVKNIGGVGAVHPGGTAKAVIYLPAGEYVIMCLIPSPVDHLPHFVKGMMKSLKVESGAVAANEPQAELTVRMADFSFDIPASLPAGKITIRVVNDGPEPHELNLLKLEEGKTSADVLAFLNEEVSGPPPFAPVGGVNGIDAGLTEYAELDLAPGNYVAICNIPSPKSEGHPHFSLGMIKEFSVNQMASQPFPAGRFIKDGETNYGLNFKPDGTFEVFNGENVFVRATYRVNGNILTETSNTGGCETNVSFIYTFDGKSLTLNYLGNPENDASCTGRYRDFNGVTYALAP